MNELDRPYHGAAQFFPFMTGEEFEALKADILENGLRDPILLHPDGSILDGRNRHRACLEIGVAPRFQAWDDDGYPVHFVVSKNMKRRDLTPSQRAAVAVALVPALKEEAKRRQVAQLKQGTGRPVQEIFPERERGQARDKAATAVGANPHYVTDAAKLEATAPDLFEQVRDGTLTIPQARREAIRIQNAELPEPVLPEGVYSVIYADPAWSYDNSGFSQSAASHYPTMTVDEISNLPVGDLATPDTVLFLWATSPLLPEAFAVIEAWGFQYKASMVWDKGQAPGIGWFVRTEHEMLLIATRKNNPHPAERPRSVIHESPTQHSQKPDCVYGIIESMYPGPYCELFARQSREGWTAWGNEII